MDKRDIYNGTKAALLINMLFITIIRIPYLLISITYAYDFSENAGIIVWAVGDKLFWLIAFPLAIVAHGRGILFTVIWIILWAFGITSQVIISVYQLRDRDSWVNTSFWHFNWHISYTLNLIFIIIGFFQPAALLFTSVFNLSGVPEVEKNNKYNKKLAAPVDEPSSDKSESYDINNGLEASHESNRVNSIISAAPIDEIEPPNKSTKFSINAPAVDNNDTEENSYDLFDSDDEKTVPLVKQMMTNKS